MAVGAARWPLAWRLSAIGVAQLVLLSMVFMGVGRLVNGAPPEHGPRGDQGPPPDVPGARPELGHHGHPPVSPLETLFCGGLLIVGMGSFLTARWIVRPLRDLARVAGAFGAGDLRARSELARNDEIGDLSRAFDDMGGRVERLVLAERELLANVSHELRTPLARIRVALDIAGEGEAEASRISMTEIGRDLAELETLIDDILTTTRLEVGGGPSIAAALPLHPEEIGADVLCERSAERLRARHPGRPLEVDVEAGLPLAEADPVLFRRVFDNLLENAHKYSPDPGAAIRLRAFRGGGGVVFEVEDHGIGIEQDDLAHVFTPFFRGDRSRTRGSGGVGLGLTLAKRIVEAHGGRIELASRAGRGTTVRIELPVHASSMRT
ncbi:MAG TPA: HAMP domain-containing sensor histidine kinase [Polyangiaceae bacterium]